MLLNVPISALNLNNEPTPVQYLNACAHNHRQMAHLVIPESCQQEIMLFRASFHPDAWSAIPFWYLKFRFGACPKMRQRSSIDGVEDGMRVILMI